jgi:hypothetical protein
MEDRMRQETMAPPAEGESDVKEAATSPTSEGSAPAATAVAQAPTRAGKLTAMLALEEPARTEALEKAATAGLTVYLRGRTGSEVRWRYGDHVLVVPETPKPFAAAHAIHLLFYASSQVEEVEG